MKEKLLMTIYLVDDDSFSVTMYQQYLKAAGYTNINIYLSRQDCSDALKKGSPDLILLDSNLAAENSSELLYHLKKNHPRVNTILIPREEKRQTAIDIFSLGTGYPGLSDRPDIQKIRAALDSMEQNLLSIIESMDTEKC